MVKTYQNPLEEIEHTLFVGGTVHADVLAFLIENPLKWTSGTLHWALVKCGRTEYTLNTVEGALRKLSAMKIIYNHRGTGYLVDDEKLALVKDVRQRRKNLGGVRIN